MAQPDRPIGRRRRQNRNERVSGAAARFEVLAHLPPFELWLGVDARAHQPGPELADGMAAADRTRAVLRRPR